MTKLTPDIRLEISIKAFESLNIEPNIIKSMLSDLEKIKEHENNLLRKYIKYVSEMEGTDFVGKKKLPKTKFTDEEWNVLLELSNKK